MSLEDRAPKEKAKNQRYKLDLEKKQIEKKKDYIKTSVDVGSKLYNGIKKM